MLVFVYLVCDPIQFSQRGPEMPKVWILLPHMDIKVLKKLKKNKKLVRKLAKKYDAFSASESLIKQVPRLLHPAQIRLSSSLPS